MRRWYDYNELIFGCWGFFAFQSPDVVGWTLGSLTALTLIYVLLFRRNDAGYNLFGAVGTLAFIVGGAWYLIWYL